MKGQQQTLELKNHGKDITYLIDPGLDTLRIRQYSSRVQIPLSDLREIAFILKAARNEQAASERRANAINNFATRGLDFGGGK